MTSKKDFEKIRDSRIKTILDDKKLSKIEKLRTIEQERLWEYAGFIQHEFLKWEKEITHLYEKSGKGGLAITDTIFDPSIMYNEKHSTVSYADTLECLLDDIEDEDDDDPLITVITTRGTPPMELKKRYSEIIDCVFDFACKNKIVGFIMDW